LKSDLHDRHSTHFHGNSLMTKGDENVGGLSLVQQEIQLSYSSHLARMVRRSNMSEWEAILADLTNGM
jgi:hypothetical protein